MPTDLNGHYADPALVVADAFRITLEDLPPHGPAILRAIATTICSLADGTHYAKCNDSHLVRACFAACREDLELALSLLTEVESAPDPDFDAEPA